MVTSNRCFKNEREKERIVTVYKSDLMWGEALEGENEEWVRERRKRFLFLLSSDEKKAKEKLSREENSSFFALFWGKFWYVCEKNSR